MLLVPRQLRRSGMTGSVPYYGGRFTPAQAYAAGHPTAPPLRPPVDAAPVIAGHAPRPAAEKTDTKAALQQLRDSGLLTAEEYDDLLDRTTR
jgi:hypothetical protein